MRKNHLPEIKQKNSFITDEFEMRKETFRSVHMANNNYNYAKNFIWMNKWQPFRWDMIRINFIIHNCTCTKLHELKPDKLLLTIYIQCKYHHWLAKCLPHKVDRIFLTPLFSLPPDGQDQHHLKTHFSQSKVQNP